MPQTHRRRLSSFPAVRAKEGMQPDDNKNIASSGFTQQSETQRVMSRNTIIQTSIDEKEKGASLGSRIGASIVGPIENNSSIYNNTRLFGTTILF